MGTKNAMKPLLIEQIKKDGLPVAVIFDFADSGASIVVKSETEVTVGDAYGDNFLEGDGKDKTLNGIDEEGLFHLYSSGVRPGEKSEDSFMTYEEIVECQKEENEED